MNWLVLGFILLIAVAFLFGMADSDYHRVTCRTENTKQKRLGLLFEDGIVRYGDKGKRVYFHALTEGTISIANTGAATDTYMVVEDATLFSFSANDVFNTTLKNQGLEKLVLMGFICAFDHTTTSPDTDDDTLDIDIGFFFNKGKDPSYNQKIFNSYQAWLELTSKIIVEAAGIETVPYCGWFIVPLAKPVLVKGDDQEDIVLGTVSEVRQADDGAYTAVTTITIKCAAYAVYVDASLVEENNWAQVSDFWELFKPFT